MAWCYGEKKGETGLGKAQGVGFFTSLGSQERLCLLLGGDWIKNWCGTEIREGGGFSSWEKIIEEMPGSTWHPEVSPLVPEGASPKKRGGILGAVLPQKPQIWTQPPMNSQTLWGRWSQRTGTWWGCWWHGENKTPSGLRILFLTIFFPLSLKSTTKKK